jgi:serine phosphatase RsbU (regulator of sigma subunit)
MLELTGRPPGLFATASYETLTLRLQPGDSVLFCTDGITDAFDHKVTPAACAHKSI